MTNSDSLSLIGFVIVLGVAIVGWAQSNRASRKADKALTLAESADAREARREARALEHNDIAWDLDLAPQRMTARGSILGTHAGRTIVATQTGTDTAHHVTLVLDIDDYGRKEETLDACPPGGTISIQLPSAGQMLLSRLRKFDPLRAPLAARSEPSELRVVGRITWTTEAGSPGKHAFAPLEVPLT